MKNMAAICLAKEYNKALSKVQEKQKAIKTMKEEDRIHDYERIFYSRVILVQIANQAFLAEGYIEGDFVKYSNNGEYVNEAVKIMTAFSHFTYDHTKKECMVTDLQGVNKLLTDPCIHTSKNIFYGQGDRNNVGMLTFLRNHSCEDNKYCKALGLSVRNEIREARVKNDTNKSVKFDIKETFSKCDVFYCNRNKIDTGHYCQSCIDQKVKLDMF